MLQISEPKPAREGARYYVNSLLDREHPPFWHGKGAIQNAVALIFQDKTEITWREYKHTLDGFAFNGKFTLVDDAGYDRQQAFWELKFGVPEHVSKAYAAAPPNVRAEMDRATEAALTRTLTLIEKRFGLGWGDLDDPHRVPANLTFAVFRSFDDQASQPQLRWDCLLMNLGVRPGGTITTLVTKPIFEARIAIGAFFRHEVRHELSERLGVAAAYGAYPSIQAGAPWELSETHSERRQHLKDFLKRQGELFVSHGLTLAKTPKLAAVEERAPKKLLVQDELFKKWRDHAVAAGWGLEQIDRQLGATFSKGSENGLVEAAPKHGELVTRLKESIATAASPPFADLSQYSILCDDCLKAEVRKMAKRKNLTLIHPDKHAEGGQRRSHENAVEQKLSPQSTGPGLLAKLSSLVDKLVPHRREGVNGHGNTEKRKEKEKTLHP